MSDSPLEGFMLVCTTPERYRGVDRDPFEPLLPESAPRLPPVASSLRISDHIAEQWKRDLFRLAEEDAVEGRGYLLRNAMVASRIRDELRSRGTYYDLIWAHILPLDRPDPGLGKAPWQFLGFDIAYLGGDFFSAIKNGLHVNADPRLSAAFEPNLNGAGLFVDKPQAVNYAEAFFRTSLTETRNRFFSYQLFAVDGSLTN